MGHRIFRAHLHVPLTAKWTSRVSGTPAGAVVAAATGGVAQQLREARQLRQALLHLRQVRRPEALVQHRLRRQAEPRQRVAVERRRRAAVEAEGVAVAISPAHPTLMAPLTPISLRSRAIRTACRR